jgi:ADP-ribose pyrophosphatase
MKFPQSSRSSASPQSHRSLFWQALSKDLLAECKVFSVSSTLAESEHEDRKQSRFYTLSCSPWVNVIAINDDKSVLMIEQYRHGIEGVTLEIPGGCIDPTDENPMAGAIRELREETGYVAARWSYLGKNHPNPALQDNLCYTFLAEGISQLETPFFDNTGTERINSLYVPLGEVNDIIRSGEITHALVITAFHFLLIERPDLFS